MAWATPTVLSTPALAAATPGCCDANLQITTPTNSNGWTRTYTPSQWRGSTPGVGVTANYTSDCGNPLNPTPQEGTGVFLVRDDPAAGTGSIDVVATYCKSVYLCRGYQYTFRFRVRSYGTNPRNQYLQVTVQPPSGSPTPLTLQTTFTPNDRYDARNYGNCALNTLAPTYTPSASGFHTFCYRHVVTPNTTSNTANDIGETGAVITCTRL